MSPRDTLAEQVRDARQRTLSLVADLGDEQLRGPPVPDFNPLLWELGRLAWLQEKWLLRDGAASALRPDADALYDSAVPHAARWGLPLPSRDETFAYLTEVHQRVLERLATGTNTEDEYLPRLAICYEDLHAETFLANRQRLACVAPPLPAAAAPFQGAGPLPGEVEVPGGTFQLGAGAGESFVLDNEQAAHPVEVKPFTIARAPVTQGEFANFVERGGYHRPQLWSLDGWRWRLAVDVTQPLYWKRASGGAWTRRDFDKWVPLEPHRPMLHVNWYEAEAYCKWVNRRLPTEAEWEAAAAAVPDDNGLTGDKRPFPWGADPPAEATAHLDARVLGCLDVAALPASDSPFGCRQMIGNVWEWTASDFLPYPGFTPGPFREFSEPAFGSHKVLRGGGWATRGRLLRTTWRQFFLPDRRDVWAGFRTCAL